MTDGSCFDPIQAVVPATLGNYESEVKHLTAGAGVIISGTLVPSQGKGQSFELQAAVDLEIMVEYGVPIAELARAVRRNVITAIEGMTGLEVVEVNINVNDVYIPGDDDGTDTGPGRVQ